MNIKNTSLPSINVISYFFSLNPTNTMKEGAKCFSSYPENIDRYDFDHVFRITDCWEQYETEMDDFYFGMWTNKLENKILVYAEGDIKEYFFIENVHFKNALKEISGELR